MSTPFDVHHVPQLWRTLTVNVFEDYEVRLSYKPAAYNAAVEKTVNLLANSNQVASALVYMLSALLTWWDVTNEGQPYLPTQENLEILPLPFVAEIMTAISQDIALLNAGWATDQDAGME